MTRVLISTTARKKAPDMASGHFFVYDYEAKKVLQSSQIIEPPYRNFDTNPRGGIRGAKGIAIDQKHIAIANSSSVFIYDHQWLPLLTISHPGMASIHDLCIQDNCIWVTSARNDLLFCFDFSGSVLSLHNLRTATALFPKISWHPPQFSIGLANLTTSIDFRDPRTHDPNSSDTAHVNSIVLLENGELLVSLGLMVSRTFSRLMNIKSWMKKHGLWDPGININRSIKRLLNQKKGMHSDLIIQPAHEHSAVIRLRKNGVMEPCILLPAVIVPSHSVRVLQDESAIYLNTSNGEVIHFDPKTKEILSSHRVGNSFLRGALQLPDRTLLLGDQNHLLQFDLYQRKLLFETCISNDENEAIFDLHLLPDDIPNPPLSFVQHSINFPFPHEVN